MNPLGQLELVGKGSIAEVRRVPYRDGVRRPRNAVVKYGSLRGYLCYNAYASACFAARRNMLPGNGLYRRELSMYQQFPEILGVKSFTHEEAEELLALTDDQWRALGRKGQYFFREELPGKSLTSVLLSNPSTQFKQQVSRKIGGMLARLQLRKQLHGDATADNFIVDEETGSVGGIDLGVSAYYKQLRDKKEEVQSTDLDVHVYHRLSLIGNTQNLPEEIECLREFIDGFRDNGGNEAAVEHMLHAKSASRLPLYVRFAFLEKLMKRELGRGQARFSLDNLFKEVVKQIV